MSSSSHSSSSVQAWHFVLPSQIGAVGVLQSTAESAQPPQAPDAVQTSGASQLFPAPIVHFSHVNVAALQMGASPEQPAWVVGLQATQTLSRHWSLSSARPAQSVSSRHSTQAFAPSVPLQKGASEPQISPLPASHSQLRFTQAAAVCTEQPWSQAPQRSKVVSTHSPPQHSASAAHSSLDTQPVGPVSPPSFRVSASTRAPSVPESDPGPLSTCAFPPSIPPSSSTSPPASPRSIFVRSKSTTMEHADNHVQTRAKTKRRERSMNISQRVRSK